MITKERKGVQVSSDDVIHITCEVDSFLFNSGVVLTVHIACLSCWVIYNVAMIRI